MSILKSIFLKSFKFFSSKSRGGVRLLLLHEVMQNQSASLRNLLVNLQEKYSFIENSTFDRRKSSVATNFMITFDDGFMSQFTIAREVLDPLNIKALFFVCPSFIESKGNDALRFIKKNMERKDVHNMSPEIEPIEWDKLRELADNGHEIGSHTMNHARLSTLTRTEDLRKEIVDSGNIIEEKLSRKINWFAYPFGNLESISKEALKIIGNRYRYSCSGLRGLNSKNTNPLCILRENVSLDSKLDDMMTIAEGGLDLPYYFPNKKLESLIL